MAGVRAATNVFVPSRAQSRCGDLRGGDAVEGVVLGPGAGVQVRPELDQEECVLRALVKQLLQPARPLPQRELVLDLPHVNRLQIFLMKIIIRISEY